jgi:hypothetical protein
MLCDVHLSSGDNTHPVRYSAGPHLVRLPCPRDLAPMRLQHSHLIQETEGIGLDLTVSSKQ